MPKFAWMFVAGAFIGDRWGWWAIAGIVALEAAGMYLTGWYEAWKADRARG